MNNSNSIATAGILRGIRIAIKSVEESIATFDDDPASNEYQRAYLTALNDIREGLQRELTRLGGGH